MEDTPQQTQPTQNTEGNTPQASQTRNAFFLGLGAFLVLILIGGVFYVRNAVQSLSEESTVVAVSRVLGMPIANVNGEKILYADYVEDKATLANFYGSDPSAPDVTPEQVSDQVLIRLVANKLIEQLAAAADIKVTEEDIDVSRQELLSQFDSQEALEEEIMNRYGWDFETYVDRVVVPVVREQKLGEAYIAANVDTDAIRTQAQGVLDRILDGEQFEPLAAEFGTDGTRFSGGDLGYFTRGVMVPAFEEAVFALEAGEVRDTLVETEFGFHIVKLEDKRTTSTPAGDAEEVRARHILFQIGGTGDFITYMDEQFGNAEIEVLLQVNNPFSDTLPPSNTPVGDEAAMEETAQ